MIDQHLVGRAGLDDLEQIMELERAGFKPAEQWSRTSWRAQLTEPALRVLVSGSDRLDGVIALRFADTTADLDRIVVAPRARRTGIARQLITAGVVEAVAAGARQMILEVRSDNQPALQLYRSSGFRDLTVRSNYYGPGQDAVMMKLIMAGAEVSA